MTMTKNMMTTRKTKAPARRRAGRPTLAVATAAALAAALAAAACSEQLDDGSGANNQQGRMTFTIATDAWGAGTDSTGLAAAARVDAVDMPAAGIDGMSRMPAAVWVGVPSPLFRSLETAEAEAEAAQAVQEAAMHDGAATPGAATTRGVVKSAIGDADRFQVACFNSNTAVDGYTDELTAENSHFYYQAEVYKAGLNWITDNAYLWQPKYNQKFYAWWPASGAELDREAQLLTIRLDQPVTGNEADAATNQRDILYAAAQAGHTGQGSSGDHQLDGSTLSPSGGAEGSTGLQFHHALTQVRFVTTQLAPFRVSSGSGYTYNYTIDKITLQNMPYMGTLNPISGQYESISDIEADDLRDFVVLPSQPTPGSDVACINEGTATFFMLPQKLQSNVDGRLKQLRIDFHVGSEKKAMTATLPVEQEWKPGQVVTYVLGTKKSGLNILYAQQQPLDKNSTSFTLDATSYQMENNGTGITYTAVPWKVTGVSIDGGKTFCDPAATVWTGQDVDNVTPWLTQLASVQGSGKLSGGLPATDSNTSTCATITAAEFTSYAQSGEELLNMEEFTTVETDISTRDAHGADLGVQNTANCYVVHEPGAYSFPAIYGCGRRDGADLAVSECMHSTFVNYDPSLNAATMPSSVDITKDKLMDGTLIQPHHVRVLWDYYYVFVKDKDATTGVPPMTAFNMTANNRYTVADYETFNTNHSGYSTANIKDLWYDAATGTIHFKTRHGNKTEPANSDERMVQANVSIALCDDQNRIIWSWHIWITPFMRYRITAYPAQEEIPGVQPAKPAFLPEEHATETVRTDGVPVGYAPLPVGGIYTGQLSTYVPRSVVLRLQQTDAGGTVKADGATAKVTVLQTGGSGNNIRCCGMLYQHGRKDPMPMHNKTISGFTIAAKSQRTMAEAIRQPNVQFTVDTSIDWNRKAGQAYWWNVGSVAAPKKSIYDPCPYGYHVPVAADINVATFLPPNVSAETQFNAYNIVYPLATPDRWGHETMTFWFQRRRQYANGNNYDNFSFPGFDFRHSQGGHIRGDYTVIGTSGWSRCYCSAVIGVLDQ